MAREYKRIISHVKFSIPSRGHSLIRSERYVPTVRAGFWTKNPLKAGTNIDSSKVKTGLKLEIAEFSMVKTNLRSHFRQISSKIHL